MASITQMHMDVVLEVQRHAAATGLDTELEYHPDEEYLPYIIKYVSDTDDSKHGRIMLFPQDDIYFTSSQLSFIIQHIRQTEEMGGHTLLVFNESSLGRVQNILETTGVTRHADLAVFNKDKHNFRMDWTLA